MMERRLVDHPRVALGGSRSAGLLEREREIALIDAAVAAAHSGRGAAVVFRGSPGSGKSRLVESACERARQHGLEALSAAGREVERDYPFGVTLQLFEDYVAGTGSEERRLLLAGAAGSVTPLLTRGPDHRPPDDRLFSFIHGIYSLCANISERGPLLLAVDDLEWVDDESLRFVSYLVERVSRLPLVLVLAAGNGALEPLQGMAELPTTVGSRLEPLSPGAVSELLTARLSAEPDERFCTACLEATGGNPFLLGALIDELVARQIRPSAYGARQLAELSPAPVARAVEERLRRLGDGALALARAVSVADEGAPLHHCAELAGQDTADAVRLADAMVEAGLLAPGRQLEFEHPIVRRALYARQPPARRSDAHRRLAELMRGEGQGDERVARQLLLANPSGSGWVVDVLLEAATEALAEADPGFAADCLRRALEEPPPPSSRGRVMLELGRAEAMAGDREGVEHLAQAAGLIDDPHGRALTALEIGRTMYAQGRQEEAAEAFRRGAEEAGEDRELRLQLLTSHSLVNLASGLPRTELEAPPPHAGEQEARDTPAGRLALARLALEHSLRGGPSGEVREMAYDALAGGALLAEETSDGLGVYFAASALVIAEDLQAAEAALSMAMDEAVARGSVLGLATARYFRGWAVLRRGRVDDAQADAESALKERRRGWGLGVPGAHAILAEAHLERGATGMVRRELERGTQEITGTVETPLPLLAAARAAFLLHDGRTDDALRTYLKCGQQLERAGITNPACIAWRSGAGLASARLGDLEQAERLFDEEIRRAREFGAAGALGRALSARARTMQDDADRIETLREAVACLRDSQLALERARALVGLGTVLRRAKKRQEARGPLRDGLDLAARCGARALARHALSEIKAAGARPRRTALSGIEALTPREREIATLAARGLSNREISELLFVTLKTVEYHLHHTYRKLSIRSRAGLATLLIDPR